MLFIIASPEQTKQLKQIKYHLKGMKIVLLKQQNHLSNNDINKYIDGIDNAIGKIYQINFLKMFYYCDIASRINEEKHNKISITCSKDEDEVKLKTLNYQDIQDDNIFHNEGLLNIAKVPNGILNINNHCNDVAKEFTQKFGKQMLIYDIHRNNNLQQLVPSKTDSQLKPDVLQHHDELSNITINCNCNCRIF